MIENRSVVFPRQAALSSEAALETGRTWPLGTRSTRTYVCRTACPCHVIRIRPDVSQPIETPGNQSSGRDYTDVTRPRFIPVSLAENNDPDPPAPFTGGRRRWLPRLANAHRYLSRLPSVRISSLFLSAFERITPRRDRYAFTFAVADFAFDDVLESSSSSSPSVLP